SLLETNQGVPVRVCSANGNSFDVLSVHMKSDLLIVGNNRKSSSRRWRSRSAVRAGGRIGEPVTQLVAREYCCTQLCEVFITARMIAVNVRIDHVTDRTRRDLLDRSNDLIGQWSELRVHHQNAIGTGENADGAALTFKRVEIVGNLRRLDLDG